MAFKAEVLLDSLAPSGARLTTMVLEYPRWIHSEFMTHRVFSRSASSSRAIPTERLLRRLEEEPALPIFYGANCRGMQAAEPLAPEVAAEFEADILALRDRTLEFARKWAGRVHKQTVNRYLEPWSWIAVIASATTWGNFFNLRCDPAAQPEMQRLAEMIRDSYFASTPRPVAAGEWHRPFVRPEEYAQEREHGLTAADWNFISAARCARVSYLNHDGTRDVALDLQLGRRLAESGHWSPFEHIAQSLSEDAGAVPDSNFRGWRQFRKLFAGENREQYGPRPARDAA